MNKKILATLCVTIFVLATLATVQQVSAHYTLGDQLPASIGEVNAGGLPVNPSSGAGNGQPRFHLPSAGGHVAGHQAFVQPGTLYIPPSDQINYYSPDGAVLTDTVGDLFYYICVSDFTKGGEIGTPLSTEQAGPINISWRGAKDHFLTRAPLTLWELSKWIYIAIPPEFTPPVDWAAGWGDSLTTNQGFGDSSNIETTITNDHNMIQTGKFGPRHPVAPNWWFVRISATPEKFPGEAVANLQTLFGQSGKTFNTKYMVAPYFGSSGFLYPPNMDPWADRQMRTGDFQGCYRIKIMNMKAPTCAGKYFFKTFYTSTDQPFASIGILPHQTGGTNAISAFYDTRGGWPDLWQMPDVPAVDTPAGGPGYPASALGTFTNDPWAGYLNGYFEKYDTFEPENYAVILVKGEIDPGYIQGTVRYCGHSQYYYGSYYGAGVHTSGKVIAEGTALDPVTGQPTGRQVCAVGWFLGQLPGQGEWWKDRQTGSEGYYQIEGLAPGIYTLTAYAAGFVPRTLATQLTVNRGQSLSGVDIYVCPTAKLQTKVFSKCPTGPVDWPVYVTMDNFPASLTMLPVVPGGASVRGTTASGGTGVPVGPDGVWYWATEGATTVQAKNIWADLNTNNAAGYNPTPAALGAAMNAYDTDAKMNAIKDKYGWAWQELVDSNGTVVAYQDYTFDIGTDKRTFGTFWGDPSCYSGVETMWDGHVPTFLADFTSGILPGTYRVKTWVMGYVQTKEYTIDFPAVEFPGTAYMEMDLFKGGVINATVHFHIQELPSAEQTITDGGNLVIEAYDANGVLQAWNSTADCAPVPGRAGLSLLLIGQPNAWSEMGRVHGMPEGTYTIKAFKPSWVQQEFPQTTIQYCTNGSLSFHLIEGANIKTTAYSRDCQDPSQPVDWKHPGEIIDFDLFTATASFLNPNYHFQGWSVQVAGTNSMGISLFTGLLEGGGGGVVDYYRAGVKGYGLPTDTYSIAVKTPGYVQLQIPTVWAQKGVSTGDIPVYLLVGAEIRVVVDFKTELIPAALPPDFWSYYFRIQAFDENGTLMAANITAVPQATFATYSQYPWPGGLNPAQPGGVQTWVFQLQGFSPFSTVANRPLHGGVYSAPTTSIMYWQYRAYSTKGPKSIFNFAPLYGPGDQEGYGLMWGKTYTILVTEENQIGYTQLATVTATPTCMGITTVVFEMDKMARISGMAYVRNWMGDFRSGSWQDVSAQGAQITAKAWGPIDGFYYTYVKPDTYTVVASGPGVKSGSRTVVGTWGGVAGGQDFYLEESGVPIPEFPAAGLLALVSALAASLYLLRWKKHTAIPLR
ncbi:MAG: carboxypeptidase-like regulatory domain-containing protein [Candidatus Bathyarchaeota archaeon]|nr:carboxypeptidase-like regulatory domain-containing protein [Candidatus Bathyarchaeota archaeon]